MPYCLAMAAPDIPGNEFGRWLEEAIYAAGYRSVRSLGRDAGVDPSLINRWISGATQPTAGNLRKLAAPLKVIEADLFAAAYPADAAPPPPLPIPRQIAALIEAYHALDDETQRKQLLERTGWVVEWAQLIRRKG